MANRFARKAGNWDAADVWSDTPSGAAGAEFVPGAGDVAHANSFAITINVNATCSQVRTDNANGATTGGSFTLNDGITLTAAVIAGTGIGVTLSSGSATIVGDVTGGTGTSIYGCRNSGTGTLTVTGNVTGGSATAAHGAYNASTGTIAISGNATGVYGSGASNISSGTITVGGNATGGISVATTYGLNVGTGVGTVTGDAIGGSYSGSSANNAGATVSSGTLTVGGDAIGGTGAFAVGVLLTSNGTATVNGDAIGNGYGCGAYVSGTGTLTIDGAVRCGTAYAGVGGDDAGLCLVGGPLYRKSTVDGGDPSRQPISCEKWAFKAASTMQYEVGLHDSGALVTFAPTEAVLTVSADTLTRLAVCATVDSTGAQIAALGPTE